MFDNLDTQQLTKLTKKPTIQQLEKILWNGIKNYADKGGKIRDRSFGSMDGCRCALSCLVNKQFSKEAKVQYGFDSLNVTSEYIARSYLKFNHKEINNLVLGFDNQSTHQNNSYYLLGQRLRHQAQKLPTWVGTKG